MVERSNSSNSGIDWIVHSIKGSRPHGGNQFVFRFDSFSATLIAWTERLRIREALYAHVQFSNSR